MKIMPDLTEVKKIASEANYNVLPVSLEMLSDFTTPIETMRILKNVSTHCYMLESAQANETWGRYTFLGFDSEVGDHLYQWRNENRKSVVLEYSSE